MVVCFLDLTPKAQPTKAKINKWDDTKLKRSGTAKGTIDKMKRQTMDGRKYLQTIYLIWGSQTKYIRNSDNSMAKKQTA